MPLKNELLNRWLGRVDAPAGPDSRIIEPVSVSADWHMQLDPEGHVIGISKSLGSALGTVVATTPAQRLLNYLMPSSALVVEGEPQEWLGHMLDLDFKCPDGHVLHTRGWVQAQAGNWLLQLLDIGDLMEEATIAQNRQHCLRLAGQVAEKVRGCHIDRLQAVAAEQLEELAQHYRVPCLALALAEPGVSGWRIYAHYNAQNAPQLWQDNQRLGTDLNALDGMATHQIDFSRPNPLVHLQSALGNAESFLLPHHKEGVVKAWLLFGFFDAAQQAPELWDREWMNLCSALAGPILYRQADQAHRHQLERLAVLQDLPGTGWWELLPDTQEIQLAPQLVRTLGLPDAREVLSLGQWLQLIHPADRRELESRFGALREHAIPLLACVRLHREDPAADPFWLRIQGQVLGSGPTRRVLGIMFDVSDIKNQ